MTTNRPGEGDTLGQFRIGRQLGVGGMGVVYQALDVSLDRQVALKVISPHLAGNDEFRARFVREAQAQASLDSPHVVQVYSFGETEGHLYIATQLIPDGDLGTMLAEHGPPPSRTALSVLAQVADGLAAAHEAGLVHRDIKPANVLLRRRGGGITGYLADFGIARRSDADHQITVTGGTVGTPSFMAPELHTGAAAGVPTDLYSMGCLLWCVLAGEPPYRAGTDFQLVLAHAEAPIPQLAATGPQADQINRVLRLTLAKQPGQRYPTAAALRDDLDSLSRMPEDAVAPRPAGGVGQTVAAQEHSGAWQRSGPGTPTPPSGPVSTPVPAAMPAPRVGAPPTHGRRLWPLVAIAAVLVVAAGVTLGVLLGKGDGGSHTAGDGERTSVTDGPSPSVPTDETERKQRAVAALTEGFSEVASVAGPDAAGCMAQRVVDGVGVDKLVESGVLREDLTFDPSVDIGSDPDLTSALTEATFACVGVG